MDFLSSYILFWFDLDGHESLKNAKSVEDASPTASILAASRGMEFVARRNSCNDLSMYLSFFSVHFPLFLHSINLSIHQLHVFNMSIN